jgi:chromosome segregation ATPase
MYTVQTGAGQIRAVVCDPNEKEKLIIRLSEEKEQLINKLQTCEFELYQCRQGASKVDAVTARENATQERLKEVAAENATQEGLKEVAALKAEIEVAALKEEIKKFEVAALKAEIEKSNRDAKAAAVEAVKQDNNLRTIHEKNAEAWKGNAKSLRAEIDKLTKANAEVRAKLNAAQSDRERILSLVHELMKLCEEFEKELKEKNDNLAEVNNQLLHLNTGTGSKDEKIKRLEEDIESLEAQIAEYKDYIKSSVLKFAILGGSPKSDSCV